MSNPNKIRERGIALFFAVFALFLLTGIAAALLLMANTESTVNSNYRGEQIAYFGAKAGIEEARARMMAADPAVISPLPTTAPTTANNQIIYIVNGTTADPVQPWNQTNKYADDELCHDNYGLGMTAVAPDVKCVVTEIPTGTGWYTSTNSALPFHGTSGALSYKWVRIAPKLNGSMSYLTGSGSTATPTMSKVYPNATKTYTDATGHTTTVNVDGTTPICWDGQNEYPLLAAHCSDMLATTSGAPMTNVYLITALGVSASGARKMLQTEAALTPTPPFPYGLYATSTVCPAISFSGNPTTVDSYTTANGGTYDPNNVTPTGGDIGANGSISVQNGTVVGIVGVLPPATNPCPTPFSIGAQGHDVGAGCVSTTDTSPTCHPNTATYLPAPYPFSTPPAPNPMPTNTSCAVPHVFTCLSLTPGTYGNISLNGNDVLTLAPGTYNINSINMQGNGPTIKVVKADGTPGGTVVLNIAGVGQTNPLALAGTGIIDDGIPNDFIINYGGTGTVSIQGSANATAILNAPNAILDVGGSGEWYGSVITGTASLHGGGKFHFDRNSALAPPSNGYLTLIGYHAVSY